MYKKELAEYPPLMLGNILINNYTDPSKYEEMITVFLADSNTLFDISSCKCQPIESCACEKSRKVPVIEQEF